MEFKQREYYLVVGRLVPDNNADLIIKGVFKIQFNQEISYCWRRPLQ